MWNRPGNQFGNCVTALEYTLLTRAAGELYRRVTVGDTIETPLFRDFPVEHQTYYLGYIMMHLGSPRTEPPEPASPTESTIAALFEVLFDQCYWDDEMKVLLSSVWAEHIEWDRGTSADVANDADSRKLANALRGLASVHERESQEWASLLMDEERFESPLEKILEAILDTFLHDRDYELHAVLTEEDLLQWEFSKIPLSEIKRQTEFLMRLYDLSTKPLSEHLDANKAMAGDL